jgi:nucleoside-diphosphate-sugar epimerase
MQIYIFGANGWLGKCILNQIVNDFGYNNVLAYDKVTNSNTLIDVKYLDILDYSAINTLFKSITPDDVLINCIGIIHPKYFVKEFYKINYKACKNLFNHFIKMNGTKIIHISSNSPLGLNRSNNKVDAFFENSKYNPYMHYGKSKMLIEQWLLSLQNVNVSIIRAPWFYGFGMPERQSFFYKNILNNKFPIFGDGNNVRSVVNVSHIAMVVSNVIKFNKYNMILHVCDKYQMSQKEMHDIIKKSYMLVEPSYKYHSSKHLPSFISTIARIIDKLVQSIGLYSKLIHVLGEMNTNIFFNCDNTEKELDISNIDVYEKHLLELYKNKIIVK